MTIPKILLLLGIMLFCFSCTATKAPETTAYPRMPDAYRDKEKNKEDRNPVGMSILDAAEKAADEDYYGTEVVPLEESRRILKERKEAEKGKAAPSGQTTE